MQTTNNHSRFSPLILYCWIVLDYCSCCLLSESLIFWVYFTPQFIAVFFKFVFFPAYVVCGLINLSIHVYHSLQSLCNTDTISPVFHVIFLINQSIPSKNMNGDKMHPWRTPDVVTRNQSDVDLSCLTEHLNSSYISFMILIIFDSIPYFFFYFSERETRFTIKAVSKPTICIYKDDLHSQLCSMMIRKQNNFLKWFVLPKPSTVFQVSVDTCIPMLFYGVSMFPIAASLFFSSRQKFLLIFL